MKNAIVMCAGKGLGLMPLTESMPKPLMVIKGKSMLHRIMEGLKDAGIENAYFVTNYLEDMIIKEAEAICKELGMGAFFIHQENTLGTADAVKSAKGRMDGPFMVVSGDHVLDVSIYKDAAEEFRGESLVVLKRVKNPSNYGVAEVENGIITGMVEKPKAPKTDLANLGIYLFNQTIFDELDQVKESQRNEYEITDVLKGKNAFVTGKYWLDVGLPWSLLDAMDFLFGLEKKKITVERGGVVRDSVKMYGNIHIGKGCIIRNSTIRDSCIGEGCRIEDMDIDRSIVGKGSEIMSSTISHSIIGNGARIEDAVLESKVNARIMTRKGEKTSPGEFGSVIGDGASVNGRILPGSLVPKR